MDTVDCPYCEEEQEINHDDGAGYEEDIIHQQECRDCEKTFIFTSSISFYFEAEKADCLNEKKCDYKPTTTAPKFLTKMRCGMCYEAREPTEEEKRAHQIPPYPHNNL